jgi:hypothetical protein
LADLNVIMAESEAVVTKYGLPERQLKRAWTQQTPRVFVPFFEVRNLDKTEN